MKNHSLIIFLSMFIFGCDEPLVKQNSKILISFSLINENKICIDSDTIPTGPQKLKIIVGENWLWPTIDDSFIGMKKNDTKILKLSSEIMFKNQGVFYLDNRDTIQIIKANENLILNVRILEII